jgi:hypothetical protein
MQTATPARNGARVSKPARDKPLSIRPDLYSAAAFYPDFHAAVFPSTTSLKSLHSVALRRR